MFQNSKHQIAQNISIGTKGAFCGLQNTPKYVSGRGSAPDRTGELTTLPDPLVGWGGDIPPHSPPLVLAMRPLTYTV